MAKDEFIRARLLLSPGQKERIELSLSGVYEIYCTLFAQEGRRMKEGVVATPLPLLRFQAKSYALEKGFPEYDQSLFCSVAELVYQRFALYRRIDTEEDYPYQAPHGFWVKGNIKLEQGGYLFVPWLGRMRIVPFPKNKKNVSSILIEKDASNDFVASLKAT